MIKSRAVKLAAVAALCASASLGGGLVACGGNGGGGGTPEAKTGMFFKPDGYADKVYAIREADMTGKELTAVSSLQGILAQDRAAVYIEGSLGSSRSEEHTSELQSQR